MERINKARLTSAMIGVPCNLADETWKNKLLSHGYDKDQKTFGSLLGISYYLEEADFVFDREVGKEMILNGSSEFIGEMASAISMCAFNYVRMKYVGADGVAAFAILGFVVYGYSMVCIGFGQGLSPIVSICWGAKEKETATKIRSITNRISLAIGTLTALSFFIAGKRYAEIFGCSNSIADMVATGFRIYAITFLAMGYDVTGSMYFTSCGDAKSSAIISSLRGIMLLLAFILIFPAIFGMDGVWMASPCAETLTAIVTFVLVRRQVRKNKEEENWKIKRALP